MRLRDPDFWVLVLCVLSALLALTLAQRPL